MNKILLVLSFVALVFCGCNTSPDGPTYGTDAGVTPVGDSGPTVLADAATTTSPPTPWRHCGADGMSPTRFRISVLDGANGPLGTCAAGWDPIALALPGRGDIYVPGSDIDQRVDPSWSGAEVDFNFICAATGLSAVLPAGTTPMARNVRVEVWYDPDATGPSEDVSSIVTTANGVGGQRFRLPLCSSLL